MNLEFDLISSSSVGESKLEENARIDVYFSPEHLKDEAQNKAIEIESMAGEDKTLPRPAMIYEKEG